MKTSVFYKLRLVCLSLLAVPLTALADSCPYCKKEYGHAAPGDASRIAAIRAAHEASCPARRSSPNGSDVTRPPVSAAKERANQRAYEAACELNRKGVEASKAGNFAAAVSFSKQAMDLDPYQDQIIIGNHLLNWASLENHKGNTAFEKQDYATSLTHYKEALRVIGPYQEMPAMRPKCAVVLENIAKVERAMSAEVAHQAQEAREKQRDANTTGRLRDQLKNFSQTLNNSTISTATFDGDPKSALESAGGGLEFMSLSSRVAVAKKSGLPPNTASAAAAETSTDARVVDLRDAKTLTVDPAKLKGYAKSFHGFATDPEVSKTLEQLKTQPKGNGKPGPSLRTESYAQLVKRLEQVSEKGMQEGKAKREQEVQQKVAHASGAVLSPTEEIKQGMEIVSRAREKEDKAVLKEYREWQRNVGIELEKSKDNTLEDEYARFITGEDQKIRSRIQQLDDKLVRGLHVIEIEADTEIDRGIYRILHPPSSGVQKKK